VSGTVRVAVLGTGRIGAMHAELLAHRIEGASLAVVYDAEPERARSVAAELGVDAAATAGELYASPDVDAIAICSNTAAHVDEMVASAAAGKAIFCEKPLSLDLDEVDRGLAAVRRAGVLFQVGFNRRFDPAHQSVRDAVAAGTIGEVHVVRITSRDPAPPPLEYARRSGGLFLDTTIHDFDMARYVTGSEVVEVFARGATRIAPDSGELDTAVVALVHDDAAFTVIDNSRKAAYGYDQRVEAFGSLGVAASENPLAHTGLVRTRSGTHAPTLPYFFLERYIPSYVREWDAFVRAFREGLPSPVGPADGRAPLVIGLAAGLSHREGRPVRVDEIG
jgi:myo-inositol 2-dehydrogenase / D-chiro-inositol 1-dehydrogenase